MEEQFEYGELVEVRDHDHEEWIPAVYVGVLPGYNWYWTRAIDVNKNSEASPIPWKQIRKIQKPEPELIDIEQPEKGTIEYLQEQVEFLQKRLIELELKFEAKEIDELKTQLK